MFIAFSVLLICTAIGLIYYWIDFYIKGGVQAVNEDLVYKIRESFYGSRFMDGCMCPYWRHWTLGRTNIRCNFCIYYR